MFTNADQRALEAAAAEIGARIGVTYKSTVTDGYWKCVGFWSHPEHRDYHKNWTGQYAIMQEYGNYGNPILLAKLEKFEVLYTLAWESMKVCRFCGFSRMAPCTKRQTCPNLTDHMIEPDDTRNDEEAA